MGLVMSHTYNLSHAYLSHTHTVKHPTSVALLRATEWLDIVEQTQDKMHGWALKYTCLAIVQLQSVCGSLLCHMQSNIVSQAIGQVAEQ